jgi:hypothetical protein
MALNAILRKVHDARDTYNKAMTAATSPLRAEIERVLREVLATLPETFVKIAWKPYSDGDPCEVTVRTACVVLADHGEGRAILLSSWEVRDTQDPAIKGEIEALEKIWDAIDKEKAPMLAAFGDDRRVTLDRAAGFVDAHVPCRDA